jgi:hypothetical protein
MAKDEGKHRTLRRPSYTGQASNIERRASNCGKVNQEARNRGIIISCFLGFLIYMSLRFGVFVVRFARLKSGAGRSLPFGVILSAREKTNPTNRAWLFRFAAVAGRGRDYFSATVFVRGQRAGEG